MKLVRLRDTTTDSDTIHSELGRILTSPGFIASDRLSKCPLYIVEETLAGRAQQTKEYVIGLSGYGKPAGYEP